ncbi:hypothetical protein J9253_09645 [Thiothrix litoralis]|uniref:Uncharacterized protein n=1 Tax=Thiothrix litoralis TaxID=2891210 RepID=A0ABX7WYN7_9GAMM|nr:hypothetical protein [Thiothrix litoralis]QTR48152.1 hypothetical protein J9253_09645 [Thiothrix litoralis]
MWYFSYCCTLKFSFLDAELTRYVGCDVKRIHEGGQALVELGLLEHIEKGALL